MKIFIFLSLISLSMQVLATGLPANNLHLKMKSLSDGGISEQEFNRVLDQIQEVFGPVVKSYGAELRIDRDWESDTVNAYADRVGKTWILKILGGFARHSAVTSDGFAYLTCHELGHHLGGYTRNLGHGFANEGQSDYYAAHVCTPYLWRNEAAKNASAFQAASQSLKDACVKRYTKVEEQHLCARVAASSYSLAKITGEVYRDKDPSFETRDSSIVVTTDDYHPHAQCRLDTAVAAALCGKPYDLNKIPGGQMNNTLEAEQESFQVTCAEFVGDLFGSRPKCWFKGIQ